MNALLIGALARARMAARPVRKSMWSDDHRNPHTYAPHDAITREGVRALQTEGLILQLGNWREEKTDHGLLLVADMGLWHGPSGLAWPMSPWKEPLKGGENRSEAWHAAQVAARAYAHREVCSLEVLDESRAAGPAPAPVASAPPVDGDGLTQEDRDEFARAVNAPTEAEERELRKSEAEAKLRAGLAKPTNGTTPHLDPEPTIPPHPAVAFDATTGKAPVPQLPLRACPGCRSPARIFHRCGGCGRDVCSFCVPGDTSDVDGGPSCSDCETAEENADCAPPFLFDILCQKAREILDLKWKANVPRAEQLEAALLEVGAEVLGRGPLGWLLKFDGAVFRLNETNIEAWLRGDVTVGLDEDEDEDGSPTLPPAAEGNVPPAVPSNPGSVASGASPAKDGCKAVAPEPTPPSPGGVPHTEPSAPSSLLDPAGPAANPPEVPAVESPAEASGGGAPLRCPDCLAEVRDLRAFIDAFDTDPVAPCPSCETDVRLVAGADGARWLEVPELLLGFLEHVPTGRKVKYGARRVRLVTVSVLPGADVDTVDVTELRAWEEPEGPAAPKGKGKKEKPSKASPGPVVIPEDEEGRKALGATWAPMKAHRATKKAPADPCPLCEKPIVKGATYRAGNAALGKALVHDQCVFRLQEGRDPRLSQQASLEEDAKRAMAAAGGAP